MLDNLTEDKLSKSLKLPHYNTATSIMVLISQENSSFNLLSRLCYIL